MRIGLDEVVFGDGGLRVFVEAFAGELAHFVNGVFGDFVEHLEAFAFAGEEAGLMEKFEVFGDVGLGGAEVGDEFSHTESATSQFLQDGEPGGIGKGGKNPGDFFQGRARQFLLWRGGCDNDGRFLY